MKLSDYTYVLPKHCIAQNPPKIRGQAKLLVLNSETGEAEDKKYSDVIDYLNPGDVLVLNNTRVIKARLIALGSDGVQHELLLIEKHGHEDEKFHHKAVYRGRIVEGMQLTVGDTNILVVGVYDGGLALLESPVDFMELARKYGHVPLPPYMKRDDSAEDALRYQTEFAKSEGSVAAPTASLNMTKVLIDKIKAKGVRVCYLTLHVGLGTFMPIRTDEIAKHKMHSEWFSVPAETVEAIKNAKQNECRVVAVGTTVARTLEYIHEHILKQVQDGYRVEGRDDNSIVGEADIFIYPGYKFKIIDALLTNFHAPKSTVLMLAAAFAGWGNLNSAYQHALDMDYRFLSYGDSMLII